MIGSSGCDILASCYSDWVIGENASGGLENEAFGSGLRMQPRRLGGRLQRWSSARLGSGRFGVGLDACVQEYYRLVAFGPGVVAGLDVEDVVGTKGKAFAAVEPDRHVSC